MLSATSSVTCDLPTHFENCFHFISVIPPPLSWLNKSFLADGLILELIGDTFGLNSLIELILLLVSGLYKWILFFVFFPSIWHPIFICLSIIYSNFKTDKQKFTQFPFAKFLFHLLSSSSPLGATQFRWTQSNIGLGRSEWSVSLFESRLIN